MLERDRCRRTRLVRQLAFRGVETLLPRWVMAGDIGLRVDYYDASPEVFERDSVRVAMAPAESSLTAAVDFDWGGSNPVPDRLGDQFAARWTGQLKTTEAGEYAWRIRADDGVRMWLNGVLIIDRWFAGGGTTAPTARLTLGPQQQLDLRIDYFDAGGPAQIAFEWDRPDGIANNYTLVEPASLIPWSQPITIQQGGTYVGAWQSLDPTLPAIQLATVQPIIITHSQVRGKTDSDNDRRGLVNWQFDEVDLTVTNTHFQGIAPGIPGGRMARAINLLNPQRFTFEHNFIEGTTGLRILNWQDGNGQHPPAELIRIRFNEVHNIDGRRADASGLAPIEWKSRTRLSDGVVESGSFGGNFIQFDSLWQQPNVEIAWNQIIHDPGESLVEDTISTYQSGGTATSPFLIHDNYVQGGYLANPRRTGEFSDGTYLYNYSASGSGMQINDNAAGFDAGHIHVYNNQVVGHTNAGITLSGGHHIEIYNNRVVSSARLPDGQVARGSWTGMYAWDFYGTGATRFYDNTLRDNVLGWMGGTEEGNTYRNDRIFSDPGFSGQLRDTPPAGVTWTNNQSLTSDPQAEITPDHERQELVLWLNRLRTAGITPGLTQPLVLPPVRSADLNQDESVDAADAGLMFLNWGLLTPRVLTGDLNRDRQIDAADAEILFAAWTGDFRFGDWGFGDLGFLT